MRRTRMELACNCPRTPEEGYGEALCFRCLDKLMRGKTDIGTTYYRKPKKQKRK